MISDYRLQSIDKEVNKLHKSLQIYRFPIRMPQIIRDHYRNKIIMKDMYLSDTVDVVSNYDEVHDLAVFVINRNRRTPSLFKRLNFSLAHELAHIELKHYKIYKRANQNKIDRLEEEANEFAARFLVPECINSDYSISDLSDYYFVSKEVICRRKMTSLQQMEIDKNKVVLDKLLEKHLYDI